MARKAAGMERFNGVEPDTEGAFVYYDDAQRALDAERANRLAMEACVDRDVKAIKDLKAQLAILQAQLRQVEGERDEARHRVDELESREIDVEILQGDLDTLRQLVEALQREVEELTAANQTLAHIYLSRTAKYYRLASQMGLVVMCRVQIEEQPTEESLC